MHAARKIVAVALILMFTLGDVASAVDLGTLMATDTFLSKVAMGAIVYEADMGRYPRKKTRTTFDDDGGGLEDFPFKSGNNSPFIDPSGGNPGNALRFLQNDSSEFGAVAHELAAPLSEFGLQFDVRVNGLTGGGFSLFEGFSGDPAAGGAPSTLAVDIRNNSVISSGPPAYTTSFTGDDGFGEPLNGVDVWNFSADGSGSNNEDVNLVVGDWYRFTLINHPASAQVDLFVRKLSTDVEGYVGTFRSRGDLSELGFFRLGSDLPEEHGDVSFDNITLATVPEPSSLALAGLGAALLALLGRRRRRTVAA